MFINPDVLAAVALTGVLPFLVIAFCYWRIQGGVRGRTPADARRRAQKISFYAIIVGVVAGLFVLGGMLGAIAALDATGSAPGAAAAAFVSLTGVLIVLTLIPVFTAVGQLRRLDRDDQEQLEIELDRSTGWIERWKWAALAVAFLIVSALFGVPGVILPLVLFFVVPAIIWYRQRGRESQLLWLLALTVRQKRDLAGELQRHACAWSGFHACQLRELAILIREGRSLATALSLSRPSRQGAVSMTACCVLLAILPVLAFLVGWMSGAKPMTGLRDGLALALLVATGEALLWFAFEMVRLRGLLPDWCLTALRVGEESGTLEAALTECATGHLQWMKNRYRTGSFSGLICYLGTVSLFLGNIAVFLGMSIVPKYRAIFSGFGTELPEWTTMVYDFLDTPAQPLAGLLPGTLLLLIVVVWIDHIGWRSVRWRVLLPLYRRLDGPDILRHLARTIENGQPLIDGLLALANSHHRPVIAKALARTVTHVENGGDCWQQLARLRFLNRRDLAVIESAERTGNPAWALREVAATREQRLQYRFDTLLVLLRPVAIVVIGALVASIALAMVLPIVKLINDLA